MSMVWPTLGSRTVKEQNRTEQMVLTSHTISTIFKMSMFISLRTFYTSLVSLSCRSVSEIKRFLRSVSVIFILCDLCF